MMKNYSINIACDLDDWENIGTKTPITIDFSTGINSHVNLTGMSGSAKSFCALALIAKLVEADPNAEIFLADYKGDDVFAFLRKCNQYFFYKDTTNALDIVHKRMRQRMSGKEIMENQITLVWDEYVSNILALHAEDSKFAKKVMNQISEILFLGRSLGIRLITTCQRPDAVAFPAGSRLNYGIVIILGAPIKSTYEMLLPSREYIQPLENRKFNRGEGVLLLQGLKQYIIKVPIIRDIKKVQRLCKKGLGESEGENNGETNERNSNLEQVSSEYR